MDWKSIGSPPSPPVPPNVVDSRPRQGLSRPGCRVAGRAALDPAGHVRPARAQRRRQVDADAHPRRAARADLGLGRARRPGDHHRARARVVAPGLPAAGLRLLPQPDRRADARAPPGPEGRRVAARDEAAGGRAAGARQPGRGGQAQGQDLLGRHAPAPGHRAGDRGRPAPPDRRRTDGRPRPRGAPALLPPAGGARRRAHRAALDAHRRGRLGALPALRDPGRGAPGGRDDAGRGAHAARGRDLRGLGREGRTGCAARALPRDTVDAGRGPPARAHLAPGRARPAGFRARACDARGRLPRADAPRPRRARGRAARGSRAMKLRRALEIARAEFRFQTRRPLFWVLLVVLGLMAWGMSSGSLRISSGDSDVGGKKAFITSQFALAQMLCVQVLMLYGFFLAVAAGMGIIRDEELKVGELLHSTPLTPGEYVWGKFAGVGAAFALVLGLDLGLRALFNHAFVSAASSEFIGPFSVWNYVWPALLLAVPTLLFLGGASLLLGAWSRKPILVFALPTLLMLVCLFFVWGWEPSWLPLAFDRVLMLSDPTGFRWLGHTWLKVDRGVAFYNTQPLGV